LEERRKIENRKLFLELSISFAVCFIINLFWFFKIWPVPKEWWIRYFFYRQIEILHTGEFLPQLAAWVPMWMVVFIALAGILLYNASKKFFSHK